MKMLSKSLGVLLYAFRGWSVRELVLLALVLLSLVYTRVGLGVWRDYYGKLNKDLIEVNSASRIRDLGQNWHLDDMETRFESIEKRLGIAWDDVRREHCRVKIIGGK